MATLRASEVPRGAAPRCRHPVPAPTAGRQILPSRSPRAPREPDLEIAEQPRLGRVLRRHLGAALAAEPEPSRQLRQRAARRRGRRAWRGGVRLSLRALELGEQRAETPLAPPERLLERPRAVLRVGD